MFVLDPLTPSLVSSSVHDHRWLCSWASISPCPLRNSPLAAVVLIILHSEIKARIKTKHHQLCAMFPKRLPNLSVSFAVKCLERTTFYSLCLFPHVQFTSQTGAFGFLPLSACTEMLSEKPSWLHCQFLSLHRTLILSGVFHLSENSSPLACETFLCLDCMATVLAACSVSVTGFSLTAGLSVVSALQSSDLVTFSSFIALDKHIYLHAEYSQSFLLSPNGPWKVKDKVVCWSHHPSNPISLSTWNCPSKQDHSPLWKDSCSTGSSGWWWNIVTLC